MPEYQPSDQNYQLDEAGFEVFFKQNFAECCVYCQYKFDFNTEEAKDVVHSAFIRLWETKNTYSSHEGVLSFLKKIISNICLDKLRHHKVRRRHERFLLDRSSELIAENNYHPGDFHNLQRAIDDAVSQLPEQMKKIFEMSRYQEMRYAQIAEQLDISVKTVETQISRALVKLRKKLSDYLMILLLAVAGTLA